MMLKCIGQTNIQAHKLIMLGLIRTLISHVRLYMCMQMIWTNYIVVLCGVYQELTHFCQSNSISLVQEIFVSKLKGICFLVFSVSGTTNTTQRYNLLLYHNCNQAIPLLCRSVVYMNWYSLAESPLMSPRGGGWIGNSDI
jgi:hypothetical protein